MWYRPNLAQSTDPFSEAHYVLFPLNPWDLRFEIWEVRTKPKPLSLCYQSSWSEKNQNRVLKFEVFFLSRNGFEKIANSAFTVSDCWDSRIFVSVSTKFTSLCSIWLLGKWRKMQIKESICFLDTHLTLW